MKAKVKGTKLILPKGEVEFDGCIKEMLYYDNVIIVLISLDDLEAEDNIYGVNKNGEIIWRIENANKKYDFSGRGVPRHIYASYYVGIKMVEPGKFRGITFSSSKYFFDYKTGQITDRVTGERPW